MVYWLYPIGFMYAIYGNIYHQYTPVMLAYIPAPWILWVLIAWAYCSQFAFGGCASLPLALPMQARNVLGLSSDCHLSSLSKPRNQRMVFVIDMLRRRFQSLPVPNNPNRVLHATWPLWFEPLCAPTMPPSGRPGKQQTMRKINDQRVLDNFEQNNFNQFL